MLSFKNHILQYCLILIGCLFCTEASWAQSVGRFTESLEFVLITAPVVETARHVFIGAELHHEAIVVCSISGKTARMVSRFRPPIDILGLSVNEKTWHQLALSWGVKPVMCEVYPSVEVLFYSAKRLAIQELSLKPGDKIIITGGTSDRSGDTNTIRIETV